MILWYFMKMHKKIDTKFLIEQKSYITLKKHSINHNYSYIMVPVMEDYVESILVE